MLIPKGEVARTLVALSGPTSVQGIIPRALVQYERKPDADDVVTEGSPASNSLLLHNSTSAYGLTTIVEDMHTRKRMMAEKVSFFFRNSYCFREARVLRFVL